MKTFFASAAWFSFFMPSSGENWRSCATSTVRPWLIGLSHSPDLLSLDGASHGK
jgi:hypothetical protein